MSVTVTCAECGAQVEKRYPSRVHELRNFCNRNCQGRYRSKHYIGDKAAHWRGGTTTDRDRVMILRPAHPNAQADGYIYRYRLVAEAMIDRHLEPHEIVHHIDGNEGNDDPTNLLVTTQSVHASQYDARRPRHAV